MTVALTAIAVAQFDFAPSVLHMTSWSVSEMVLVVGRPSCFVYDVLGGDDKKLYHLRILWL